MPLTPSYSYTPVEILHSGSKDAALLVNCTVLSGQTLVKGEVVAIVTASGKIVAYDNAGTDNGTRTAVGIIKQDVDASTADEQSGYYKTGEFYESKLTAPDTGWKADLGAHSDAVRDAVTIYG